MSGERNEAEEAIAKSLRLRATPVPVARISRRALIITTTIVSIGLFGAVSWSMLEHRRAAPQAADTTPVALGVNGSGSVIPNSRARTVE